MKPVKDLYLAATDGEKVYYKGKVLENADLKTLKRVDMYTEYLADKENVYYKSKLLPIKNNGRLKVVSLEQGAKFLYDEINGYVFKEDYFFDREKSPYKALGNKNKELYIVKGAVHTDLYDGGKNHVIPFDKFESFFKNNLK